MLGIMANSRKRIAAATAVSIDNIYFKGNGFSTTLLTWNADTGYLPTAGDIILITHQCSNGSVPNTPAGWTIITKTAYSQIIARISDGTEIGLTLSGSVKGNSGIAHFLKGGPATVSGIVSAFAAGNTAPSLTPVNDGALLITMFANDNTLVLATVPTGMTLGANTGRSLSPQHDHLSAYLLDNPGAVGTGTKTSNAVETISFSVIVEVG